MGKRKTGDGEPPKKRKKPNPKSSSSSNSSPSTKKSEKKVFEIDTKLEKEFPPKLWKAFIHFGSTLRQIRQFEEFDKLVRKIKPVIPKHMKPTKLKPEEKPVENRAPRSKPLTTIEDVPFTVPRGKQQLEIYKTGLVWRSQAKVNKGEEPEGSSMEWKNVDKFFCLAEPEKYYHFLFTLKRPMQHGKHTYKTIHFQFFYNEDIEPELTRKVGKISTEAQGNAMETIGKVIETLSKKKMISNPVSVFQSSQKQPFVQCTMGSNYVKAFFTTGGIITLPKPLKIMKLDEIDQVHTIASGGRYINFHVEIGDQDIELGMLPKDDMNPVQHFLRAQNVLGPAKKDDDDEEMDWNTYESDEDEEFDFQEELAKVDVSKDFKLGKLNLSKVANDAWKEMRDISASGVLGEAEYNEEDDSDFDFEDELQRTNLRNDFSDKDLKFENLVSKELKDLIERSAKTPKKKKGENEDVVLPKDDLVFLKELEKDGRIESSDSEEEDSEEQEIEIVNLDSDEETEDED